MVDVRKVSIISSDAAQLIQELSEELKMITGSQRIPYNQEDLDN